MIEKVRNVDIALRIEFSLVPKRGIGFYQPFQRLIFSQMKQYGRQKDDCLDFSKCFPTITKHVAVPIALESWKKISLSTILKNMILILIVKLNSQIQIQTNNKVAVPYQNPVCYNLFFI
jgi:hypothetical protein